MDDYYTPLNYEGFEQYLIKEGSHSGYGGFVYEFKFDNNYVYNLKKAMKQPFTEYVDVEKEWGLPRYRSSINYKPLKLKKGEPGWRISVIAPMSAVEKFTSFKIKAKY